MTSKFPGPLPGAGATGPVEPPRTKSGQHPAVVAFRAKLESITEGEMTKFDELDQKLAEYLESVKTPVPPPMLPDDAGFGLVDDRPTPTPVG